MAAQVYRINLKNDQRLALLNMFSSVPAYRDRDERRRFTRAIVAFGFPVDLNQDLLDTNEWSGIVTRENVDVALSAISLAFSVGKYDATAMTKLDPIETLLEECKEGKHLADLPLITPLSPSPSETAS